MADEAPAEPVKPDTLELAFRTTKPFTYEACEGVLSAVADGTTRIILSGHVRDGDPRDGSGSREVTITAWHPGAWVDIEMTLRQNLRGPGDPYTSTHLVGVKIISVGVVGISTRVAVYERLRSRLADDLGFVDRTLVEKGHLFVDAAESAIAEASLAARLRAQVTEALVAEARSATVEDIHLVSPRADLEAVLAAYPAPDQVNRVTLEDSRIDALPAALARFPNLARLELTSSMIKTLRREQFAAFPKLAVLYLHDSKLEDLDLAIRDVCPHLNTVTVARTPFAENADKVAALRTAWRGVELYAT